VYIKDAIIQNFRSYENAKVGLVYPGSEQFTASRLPNVTLLLGNNGSGKSAFLKACALGVLNESLTGSGFRPYYLTRREPGTPLASDSVASTSVHVELVLHGQDKYPNPAWHETDTIAANVAAFILRTISQEGLAFGSRVSQGIFDDKSPSFLLVAYGANRRVE
jgi:hypothetical protein